MKRKVFVLGLLVSLLNVAYSEEDSYICDNKVLKNPIIASESRTQLNFTNWADYISPDIVPCFQSCLILELSIYIHLMII